MARRAPHPRGRAFPPDGLPAPRQGAVAVLRRREPATPVHGPGRGPELAILAHGHGAARGVALLQPHVHGGVARDRDADGRGVAGDDDAGADLGAAGDGEHVPERGGGAGDAGGGGREGVLLGLLWC